MLNIPIAGFDHFFKECGNDGNLWTRPSRSECLFPVSRAPKIWFRRVFQFHLCPCKITVASGTGVCISVVQDATFAVRDRL